MVNKILRKRILMGSALGILAGLICFTGFSSSTSMPVEMAQWQIWSWSNAMMWGIIISRFLLGMVVAMAGVFTLHPVFGFKCPVWFRGMVMGIWLSLPLAVGSLMNPNPEVAKDGFWIVLIAGTIIGMVIDLIITKFAGEGKELLN